MYKYVVPPTLNNNSKYTIPVINFNEIDLKNERDDIEFLIKGRVNMRSKIIHLGNIKDKDLSKIDFTNSTLIGSLENCDMSGCKFENVDLFECHIHNCEFKQCWLDFDKVPSIIVDILAQYNDPLLYDDCRFAAGWVLTDMKWSLNKKYPKDETGTRSHFHKKLSMPFKYILRNFDVSKVFLLKQFENYQQYVKNNHIIYFNEI